MKFPGPVPQVRLDLWQRAVRDTANAHYFPDGMLEDVVFLLSACRIPLTGLALQTKPTVGADGTVPLDIFRHRVFDASPTRVYSSKEQAYPAPG